MTNDELLERMNGLELKITKQGEQIVRCFERIEAVHSIADSVNKLATTVEVMVHEQHNTNEKVDKLAGDVEEIKAKPAKRWDAIVASIGTAIATAIITYLATKAGLT